MASKRKKLFITLFLLLLIPVVLLWVAIQPFFIKSVILPRVEKITESRISVDTIKLSPFSRLSLSGLNYQQKDDALKVRADSANIRYNLMAILKGTIVVDEITLNNPEIDYTQVEKADENPPSSEKPASEPPRLQIQNITATNGKLNLHLPTGALYLSEIDFSLPELRNGNAVHPTLKALISASTHEKPADLFMQGSLNSDLEIMLSDDLIPTSLKGVIETTVGENQAGVPEMSMKLDTDLSLDLAQKVLELKALSVNAMQAGNPLLDVSLSNSTQINWAQQPPVFTDTKLSLKLPPVEIPDLPFALLLPIQSGQVFLESELTVSNSGKEIQARVDFGLARLRVALPGNDGKLSLGRFSGKGEVTWTKGQDLLAELQLDAEKVVLADGRELPSPLSLRVDTQVHPTHAKLKDVNLTWAETPGFPNRIELSGVVDWKDLKAVSGQLTVRSQGADLDAWAELLPAEEPADMETATAKPVSQPSKTAPNLNLPVLPLDRVGLDLEMGKVRYNQMNVGSVKLLVEAGAREANVLNLGISQLNIMVPDEKAPFTLGRFNGKGKATWAEGQHIVAALQLEAENINLPDGRNVTTPLILNIQTRAQSTQAKINELNISWAETPGFTNRIELSGDLDWTNLKAMSGQLSLQSDAIDLDPLADLIPASTAGGTNNLPADQTTASTTKLEKADPNQPIILPPLPLERIAMDLEIGKIRFKQINLEQIIFKSQASARQLKIEDIRLNLNGSTLRSAARMDWQNPEIEMDLQASLSPLNLEPVVDSILPAKKGAVTGILQGETNFKLKGESPSELQNSFQGTFNAAYNDGKLRLLDSDPEQNGALLHTKQAVKDILSAMANALQLSPEQLMEPEIESISLDTEVNFKDLTLRNFELLNPEFLLRARGAIALHPHAEQAQIEQLPVTLGLATNLAKRVKVYRPERVEGAYALLPSFIEVNGSLGAPEIKVKKAVITGLVLSGVTERNQIGNENVQTGLEVLGSLLSGEPIPVKTPVPAPTALPGEEPTPTPKPGKTEMFLEGLQLFQQMRATPTPVPQ